MQRHHAFAGGAVSPHGHPAAPGAVQRHSAEDRFERGTLTPTNRRPFDLLAKGTEEKEWLGVRDDFRNWLSVRPEQLAVRWIYKCTA
jgi:hypothetical protein